MKQEKEKTLFWCCFGSGTKQYNREIFSMAKPRITANKKKKKQKLHTFRGKVCKHVTNKVRKKKKEINKESP